MKAFNESIEKQFQWAGLILLFVGEVAKRVEGRVEGWGIAFSRFPALNFPLSTFSA
jgi:hypothetical protein